MGFMLKSVNCFSPVIIIMLISFLLTACDDSSEKEMLYAFEYIVGHYDPYTWGVLVYADGSVKNYVGGAVQRDKSQSKVEVEEMLLKHAREPQIEYLFSLTKAELSLFKETINVEDYNGVNFLSSECTYRDITFYPYYMEYSIASYHSSIYTPKMIIGEGINIPNEKHKEIALKAQELIVKKLFEHGYISEYRKDCSLRKI